MNISLSRADAITLVALCIRKTEIVVDLGCGIHPQEYFKPKYHICVEPHQEYVDELRLKKDINPCIVIVPDIAQSVVKTSLSKSVDTIFMMDFIEHLSKEDGKQLLIDCERMARKQLIIFTPLGFCSQSYNAGDVDGWGYHGGEWQTHRSGWTLEDFSAWHIIISPNFHTVNGKGEKLDPPIAALWAIKNLDGKHGLLSFPSFVIKARVKFARLCNKGALLWKDH